MELELINEMNDYISEYLHYYNMTETLETFKKEIKSK